jgi:hypothetical protein
MGHNAIMELVRRGEFQGLLDWLVHPGGDQAIPMPLEPAETIRAVP